MEKTYAQTDEPDESVNNSGTIQIADFAVLILPPNLQSQYPSTPPMERVRNIQF